jgi:DNA-binding NarL/FixJ family response regulator
VLVVEDDPQFRLVLQMILEEDCEPVLAGTKAAARSLIPTRAWRGVLLDVRLPDGDGTALLPLIRQYRPRIPVLVMTGGEAAANHVAYAHGAQFLTKPFPAGWYASFRDRMNGLGTPGALGVELERLGLTPAEVDVFARLGNGETAAQVAQALGLTAYTVRTHCANVHRRLGVSTLAEVLGVAAGWLRRGA